MALPASPTVFDVHDACSLIDHSWMCKNTIYIYICICTKIQNIDRSTQGNGKATQSTRHRISSFHKFCNMSTHQLQCPLSESASAQADTTYNCWETAAPSCRVQGPNGWRMVEAWRTDGERTIYGRAVDGRWTNGARWMDGGQLFAKHSFRICISTKLNHNELVT